MEGVAFKPRAYEKIAEVLGSFDEDLANIYKKGGLKALQDIPGVGKSSAEKIEEYIKTGKIGAHEELKKKMPVNLAELAGIEGLGPKKIKHLYEKLGIRTLKDLDTAVKTGKVKGLSGFGEKSAGRIGQGIAFRKTGSSRFILGYIYASIDKIREKLSKIDGVSAVTLAGSMRRRRDTVGDADILAVASDDRKIMDAFASLKDVVSVVAKGETKTSVKLLSGMNVDLRVVGPDSYGAALNYFTGSKAHNIALREIAVEKGYKLNEYGLFKGNKQIAGKNEEEIYKALGLNYIEPELRENLGEIELSKKGKLPALVEYRDIQGDLQIQTDWTDGKNTIEEMAEAAVKLGRKYILITDHTKRLAMTNGLDEKRLLKQMAEIDRINNSFKKRKIDFTILKGSECDILKDGSLDLPDAILSKLDVVGASVHSYFKLTLEEQTKRIKRAMSNPNVDIIFHPTGRIINRREPYQVDMDELIRHARATRTVMEINSFPERADLKDEYIRKCVDLGVKLAINSDAHSVHHLKFLEFGTWQARRGWAKKSDIINALPVKEMLKILK